MSAGHFALVLSHSRSKGITRLVALSMCDSYDVEADFSTAPVDWICRDANASETQVNRAMDELIRLGEWARITIDGIDVMRMVMRCPIDCDRTAQHITHDTQHLARFRENITTANPLIKLAMRYAA